MPPSTGTSGISWSVPMNTCMHMISITITTAPSAATRRTSSASRIDKKYPSELRVIGVNNAYAQDYIKAAQAFFDATQNYSLYIVSYAQFGGSEYRKLLEECEELVDQCRLEVVDARLAFLSTVGLSLDR